MRFHFSIMMGAQKKSILEKSLSDGPSAILRPLYNSNVAKVVLIVIWVTRRFVAGLPKDLINAYKAGNPDIFGYAHSKKNQ